jgi:hypothetical protein
MIKRSFILCFGVLFVLYTQAQLPDDALRASNTFSAGTAREQAIGGAMGSIGGDLSANFVNPAGLGFYKSGDLILSPGYSFGHANTSYLSSDTKNPGTSNFLLGTTGAVYGRGDGNSTLAVSLAVNQSANFNGHISYQGNNNYSSAAEAYGEEFSESGLSIDDALHNPGISYATRMALYTYLIDTSTGPQGPVIVQPRNVLNAGGSLGQYTHIATSGGVTEYAIGVAGSTREKWYIGVSVGIPVINFQQTTQYTETDLSGNKNNNFDSYTYTEYYSSKGVGVNGRFGLIFRPNLNWRIGWTVTTPTFYNLTDRLSASMETNTEGYAGKRMISSDTLDQIAMSGNSFQYDLQTAWKMLISGSYIFPGQLTQGSMGFITADIEYVANKDARFSFPLDADGNQPDNTYFDPLNNTIKSYYNNTFNFRLGGEYKINETAFRLGTSYSTDPYSSTQLSANRMTFSGGVGYRKKGIIIDITYVEAITHDLNFPYRLENKDNVYATVKQYTGNIILSIGIKF